MLAGCLDSQSTWSVIIHWSGSNVYMCPCCDLSIHVSQCGFCRQVDQPKFSEGQDLEASLQLHALRQSLQTRPTSPQHLLMEQAGLKVRPSRLAVRLPVQLRHNLCMVGSLSELNQLGGGGIVHAPC